MSDLRDWTIASAADALTKGETSSVELTDAFIEAIEANRSLNAFITETPELARHRAAESDAAATAVRRRRASLA